MATRLNEIFEPDAKLWAKVEVFVKTDIRKRSFKGIDREGRKMPAYSDSYTHAKAHGMESAKFTTRSGEVVEFEHKRPERYRGISLERQVGRPNFALTRRTMQNPGIETFARSDEGIVMGWRGEEGFKVAVHEEKGKYKVGGLSPDEMDEINKIFDKHFVAEWNKNRKTTIIKARK